MVGCQTGVRSGVQYDNQESTDDILGDQNVEKKDLSKPCQHGSKRAKTFLNAQKRRSLVANGLRFDGIGRLIDLVVFLAREVRFWRSFYRWIVESGGFLMVARSTRFVTFLGGSRVYLWFVDSSI